MGKQAFIEAGRITNTHGVRGEVRIEVWLDSPDYLKHFPRVFIDGREFRIVSAKEHKNFLITALEGIGDINAAMPLKGKTVWIAREDAGLPEGGYFLQDLLGAEVFDDTGAKIGVLEEILERPASDIYVVRDEHGLEHLIPAVPEFIKGADADRGIVTVHLIEGM